MSVFNASVLLLTMNFVITLLKYSRDPLGYRLVDPQLKTGVNLLIRFQVTLPYSSNSKANIVAIFSN